MKGDRFIIKSIFLFLVFLSSNTYSICQQYFDHQIADKVCVDFQSDIEEEIENLGDFEKDETHPTYTIFENWRKNKGLINAALHDSSSSFTHAITTPPPELFP